MPEVQLATEGDRSWLVLSYEVTRVSALGGPDYPSLRLPFKMRSYKEAPIMVLGIGGTAFLWRSPDRRIADISFKPLVKSPHEEPGHDFDLDIPLFHHQIEAIEEFRKGGDLHLYLEIQALLCLMHQGSIRDFRSSTGRELLDIPQSHWVKLLPNLGYDALKVVEVPVSPKPTQQELLKALAELEKASQSYQRDYEDCVSDCRKALQPIENIMHIQVADKEPSYPDKIKAFCRQHLRPSIGESNADCLEQMIIAMWGFTSKPHHASPPYHRYDAAFALHTTAAILQYVGAALSHQQKT